MEIILHDTVDWNWVRFCVYKRWFFEWISDTFIVEWDYTLARVPYFVGNGYVFPHSFNKHHIYFSF
jgi:hypothetical protein